MTGSVQVEYDASKHQSWQLYQHITRVSFMEEHSSIGHLRLSVTISLQWVRSILLCYAGQWNDDWSITNIRGTIWEYIKSGICSLETHGCGKYYLVTLDEVVILDITDFVENLYSIYFRSYNSFLKLDLSCGWL